MRVRTFALHGDDAAAPVGLGGLDATVIAPDGHTRHLELAPSDEPGSYEATFRPVVEGDWRVRFRPGTGVAPGCAPQLGTVVRRRMDGPLASPPVLLLVLTATALAAIHRRRVGMPG